MRAWTAFAAAAALSLVAAAPAPVPRQAPAASPDGGAPAPEKPKAKTEGLAPGQLVDGAQKPVSDEQFAERAAGVQFVLIGETHTDACNHAAQARLIRAMASAGLEPVIGLEMLTVEQEQALRLFNQRRIHVDDLEDALLWDQVWGFDFELYRPIFAAAEELDLPVAGLNIPSYVAHSVAEGRVDPTTVRPRRLLPPIAIPPPPGELPMLQEEFESHGRFLVGRKRGDVPPFERFLKVQSLWDSKMAEEALRASAQYERPVAILAGSGHVSYGWGIASRLRAFDPDSTTLLVVPWRGEEPPDPQAADLFIYCPPR